MTLTAHPYADAWPMLADDELAELAIDIRDNGLLQPIVLHDGLILDGRNRYAACINRDDVKTVEFDGTDDDALAFVQSINGARRHQSKGSLAASWALSMLAAAKRGSGRWAYGQSNSSDLKIADSTRSYLGIVADFAPDLLIEIRDDRMTLNAAYEQAKAVKDAEDERLAEQAREVEREATAETFIKERDPDLAGQVGGPVIDTYQEAVALWEKRNKAEVDAKRKAEADHAASVKRHVDYLRSFLATVRFASALEDNPLRDDVLNALSDADRDRYLRIEKDPTWPITD